MNQNFDVYNKYSGNYIGSVEAENAKIAAQEMLGGPLATNRLDSDEQNEELTMIDDNTFEIAIAGTEYTIKKSTKKSTDD